jgi:hypothetical protein
MVPTRRCTVPFMQLLGERKEMAHTARSGSALVARKSITRPIDQRAIIEAINLRTVRIDGVKKCDDQFRPA